MWSKNADDALKMERRHVQIHIEIQVYTLVADGESVTSLDYLLNRGGPISVTLLGSLFSFFRFLIR